LQAQKDFQKSCRELCSEKMYPEMLAIDKWLEVLFHRIRRHVVVKNRTHNWVHGNI
jgi:CHAD domain-containing protein